MKDGGQLQVVIESSEGYSARCFDVGPFPTLESKDEWIIRGPRAAELGYIMRDAALLALFCLYQC